MRRTAEKEILTNLSEMKNIVIFASGNGTNCENIIRFFSHDNDVKVAAVITNNASAKVIDRARKWNVPVRVMTRNDINDREKLLPVLEEYATRLIVLAGFMLFIPDFLVEAYEGRIINIHPSLLPKYGGKGMYGMNVHKAVKANGETKSGITIHHVSNEYDKGRIIAQFSTPLSPGDSAEDIAMKVHELEYRHYPEVIEQLLKKED